MAQITVNIPTAQIPRLKAWLDSKYQPAYDPNTGTTPVLTDAEYLQFAREEIKSFLRNEVRAFEERAAINSARASVSDLEVTD